jgi:hypothetical protein
MCSPGISTGYRYEHVVHVCINTRTDPCGIDLNHLCHDKTRIVLSLAATKNMVLKEGGGL